MHRIVFLGPPGAGKGTQASGLARSLGIVHLSTGDLLRAAVAARSALGLEAEGYMRAGQLVPDDLVVRLLRERLDHPDTSEGFVLDGFPRNLTQAVLLEKFIPIESVLAFEIPEAYLLERLTQRRTCPTCRTVYNIVTAPPNVENRCDRDGSALEIRPDDRPEAVRTRLKVYHDQTAPLLEFYRQRGVLVPVDARGAPEEVAARVRRALEGPNSG